MIDRNGIRPGGTWTWRLNAEESVTVAPPSPPAHSPGHSLDLKKCKDKRLSGFGSNYGNTQNRAPGVGEESNGASGWQRLHDAIQSTSVKRHLRPDYLSINDREQMFK